MFFTVKFVIYMGQLYKFLKTPLLGLKLTITTIKVSMKEWLAGVIYLQGVCSLWTSTHAVYGMIVFYVETVYGEFLYTKLVLAAFIKVQGISEIVPPIVYSLMVSLKYNNSIFCYSLFVLVTNKLSTIYECYRQLYFLNKSCFLILISSKYFNIYFFSLQRSSETKTLQAKVPPSSLAAWILGSLRSKS